MDTSLLELYQQTSKHSNYQVLAPALAPLLDSAALTVQSRHEQERLAYILAHLPVQGLQMADIGGNTGFFSFELLAHGAQHVDYHEGNQAHHAFVCAAAARLGLAGRLRAHQGYVCFEPAELDPQDCTLLLNVLHHLGDDFGDPGTAKTAARQRMLECLAVLAYSSRQLVFQLGFNWKGDRHQPLFEGGSKAEMIDFIRQGTAADWDIITVGVAERAGAGIMYRDLSDRNIARDDSLGEFLNRPLFLMHSRHLPGRNPAQGGRV
jgi:hypothetical protein